MASQREKTEKAVKDLVTYFQTKKHLWEGRIDRAVKRHGFKQAAVLVPLFWKDEQLHVLLTTRSMNLSSHKGDVCFPGGGVQKEDKTVVEAALREAEEEIGLKPQDVEILGETIPYLVGKGTSMLTTHIVIGMIDYWSFKPRINASEVLDMFSLPLERFAKGEGYRSIDHFHQVTDFTSIIHAFYDVVDGVRRCTWGFTAQVLIILASAVFDVSPPFPMNRPKGMPFVKTLPHLEYVAEEFMLWTLDNHDYIYQSTDANPYLKLMKNRKLQDEKQESKI